MIAVRSLPGTRPVGTRPQVFGRMSPVVTYHDQWMLKDDLAALPGGDRFLVLVEDSVWASDHAQATIGLRPVERHPQRGEGVQQLIENGVVRQLLQRFAEEIADEPEPWGESILDACHAASSTGAASVPTFCS
ncbi:hypothetical protein, partial [Shouchella clausii]|uniref:hypothetical protein n=1 Tax=Shouchella clausii TaxID=79880 RepID=UPI00270CBAF8